MALRVAALCVAAAVVCSSIRAIRPEIALAVALAAGVTACVLSMDEIGTLVGGLRDMMKSAELQGNDVFLILRAGGLTLIGEYASQLCRDAGEGALSQRVEFSTRVTLLALSIPLVTEVLNVIGELGV